MSTLRAGYHHGDLRAACLTAAMELLAEGDEATVSLRAVAGVRGFAQRSLPALPGQGRAAGGDGHRGLPRSARRPGAADADAAVEDKFVAMAQAYVPFGVRNPALFGLMFGHPCSRDHPETSAAAAETRAVLAERVATAIPAAQHASFMIGAWALVHGLASLVMDGKLPGDDREALDAMVRSIVETMLGVQSSTG